jgi:pilus assembly protein CpaC
MRTRAIGSLAALAALLLLPSALLAQKKKSMEPRDVVVELNGSEHVKIDRTIRRVSVGNVEIADVAAFPPDQLLITGKKLGHTTAAVWVSDDDVVPVSIVVGYPARTIEAAIRGAAPGVKDLKVENAGTTLIISGEVTNAADAARAEEIARGFTPSTTAAAIEPPKVLNLLRVSGDQQVQLEVTFAEVSRSGLKQIGINFWQKSIKDNYAGGLINPSSQLPGLGQDINPKVDPGSLQNDTEPGLPVIAQPLTGAFGAIFALGADYDFPFSAALSVLANNGYARTLAEPTLVALSGQEAAFLAGGEFPMPLPQALGQVVVEFKKFGVQLNFTPTVVDDTIRLKLAMTVSDLDFSLGIKLATVTVPGLTQRHSSTTIQLKDGQSFAIAGLLSDKVRSNVDKVPGLGDLPILGMLFRSTSYRREETELLVVVTAHLVRPQGERPKVPGEDTASDPSDLELFLLGSAESKSGGGRPPHTKGASGPASSKSGGRSVPVGPIGFKRGSR